VDFDKNLKIVIKLEKNEEKYLRKHTDICFLYWLRIPLGGKVAPTIIACVSVLFDCNW